ncbi:MAG TPA: peptidylprolyl isomerase [Candidatus Eisenbacteria bacterium]|nr:peptidylprolyl isomerase [Candidatus Eisenbacteria bacterium]
MSWNRTAWILVASFALAGCAGGKKSSDTAPDTTVQTAPPAAAPSGGTMPDVTTGAAPGTLPVKPDPMPAHITVQHILIGFSGSVPGKGITRTQDEAKKLAYDILARARKGESFDALVQQYTDDAPPGIYSMANTGVTKSGDEFQREQMVPAFGNVGFAISVGNIDIADYSPQTSPYGWHIIKRLK